MTEYFKSNDPIDPKLLEDVVESKYKLLASSLSGFIPVGFNDLYTISVEKIFKTRPKVLNPSYDSISKGNTNQSSILVPYFGTPLTMYLLKQLGITTYQNQSLNNIDSFYKTEELVPYEPTSASIGGMPYKGNSPFIFRGFLGFSNFVQDTNVYIYPTLEGNSLMFKAKRLSVLISPLSENAFSVTSDSLITEADRFEIEKIDLDNLNIELFKDNIFDGNNNGIYPSKILGQDYAIWIVYSPTLQDYRMIAVPWTDEYALILGEVPAPHPNWLADYPDYTYYRCVACVYLNEDNVFEVSNETAWDEFVDTVNSSYIYSKIYQQSASTTPLTKHATQPNDRRIIPTYYYMVQNNENIASKVNFKGLIRHAVDAGINRVYLSYGANNFTMQDQVYLKIGSCELSDGTSSFWLSGDIEFPPKVLSEIELDSGGSYVAGQGYYLWVTVDPLSILDTSLNAPLNNLRIKLIASTSSTWAGVDTVWKALNLDYTYRCRVGWVRKALSTSSDIRFIMQDGHYAFTEKTWHYTTTPNMNLLASGVSTGNNYVPITTTDTFPPEATELNIELNINQTSVGDSSDQHLAMSTSSYGASSGTAVNLTLDPAVAYIPKNSYLRSTRIVKTATLSLNPLDIVYYACRTGAQAGTYQIYLTGFKLPSSVV